MRYLWFVISFTIVLSCEEKISDPKSGIITEGIFILNEGSFGAGNGDISLYRPDSADVINNLYLSANGKSAGDIVQDMLILDTMAVISINNSNKICFVRLKDFTLLSTIGTLQPRMFVKGDEDKVYLTAWDGKLKTLDLTQKKVTDSIAIGTAPEALFLDGNDLYVANYGYGNDNTVKIYNTVSKSITKTIRVGYGPRAFSKSSGDNKLFIACEGNQYAEIPVPGGIYVVDLNTQTMVDSLVSLPSSTGAKSFYPGRIAVNESIVYFISGFYGDIQKFNTSNWAIMDSIKGSFYNVVLNPDVDSDVYATDASLVPGKFKIFDQDGQVKHSFTVGDFPSGMVFYNKNK